MTSYKKHNNQTEGEATRQNIQKYVFKHFQYFDMDIFVPILSSRKI